MESYNMYLTIWHISHSLMFLSFVHVVVPIRTSFLLVAEYYFIICVCHILFICLSDGHLGCLCLLTVLNSAAVNIGIQVSVCVSVLSSSWCIQEWNFWVI